MKLNIINENEIYLNHLITDTSDEMNIPNVDEDHILLSGSKSNLKALTSNDVKKIFKENKNKYVIYINEIHLKDFEIDLISTNNLTNIIDSYNISSNFIFNSNFISNDNLNFEVFSNSDSFNDLISNITVSSEIEFINETYQRFVLLNNKKCNIISSTILHLSHNTQSELNVPDIEINDEVYMIKFLDIDEITLNDINLNVHDFKTNNISLPNLNELKRINKISFKDINFPNLNFNFTINFPNLTINVKDILFPNLDVNLNELNFPNLNINVNEITFPNLDINLNELNFPNLNVTLNELNLEKHNLNVNNITLPSLILNKETVNIEDARISFDKIGDFDFNVDDIHIKINEILEKLSNFKYKFSMNFSCFDVLDGTELKIDAIFINNEVLPLSSYSFFDESSIDVGPFIYTLNHVNSGKNIGLKLRKTNYYDSIINYILPSTIKFNKPIEIDLGRIPMVQKGKEYAFVLTWEELPSDLDTHMFSFTNNYKQLEHKYFSNSEYNSEYSSISLDHDDTSHGYEPETITIGNLDPEKYYLWTIHNYSAYQYEIHVLDGSINDYSYEQSHEFNHDGKTKLNIVIFGNIFSFNPPCQPNDAVESIWLDVCVIHNKKIYVVNKFVSHDEREITPHIEFSSEYINEKIENYINNAIQVIDILDYVPANEEN